MEGRCGQKADAGDCDPTVCSPQYRHLWPLIGRCEILSPQFFFGGGVVLERIDSPGRGGGGGGGCVQRLRKVAELILRDSWVE